MSEQALAQFSTLPDALTKWAIARVARLTVEQRRAELLHVRDLWEARER